MNGARVRATCLVALAMLVICAPAAWGLWQAKGKPANAPKPQHHENHREIDQLEEAWRQAMLDSNDKQMEQLLGEDYLAITSNGTVQTKEQSLASLRSKRLHFTSLTFLERKVRFYGNTAVVTCLAEVQATMQDGERSGNYRYTRVYARDAKGAWKIVSFEASRIREPGEHKPGTEPAPAKTQ